jgi:hypothetical protein
MHTITKNTITMKQGFQNIKWNIGAAVMHVFLQHMFIKSSLITIVILKSRWAQMSFPGIQNKCNDTEYLWFLLVSESHLLLILLQCFALSHQALSHLRTFLLASGSLGCSAPRSLHGSLSPPWSFCPQVAFFGSPSLTTWLEQIICHTPLFVQLHLPTHPYHSFKSCCLFFICLLVCCHPSGKLHCLSYSPRSLLPISRTVPDSREHLANIWGTNEWQGTDDHNFDF